MSGGLPEGVCCADGPHCVHTGEIPDPSGGLAEVVFLGRRITDWDPAMLQRALAIAERHHRPATAVGRRYRGMGACQLDPSAYGVPDSGDAADDSPGDYPASPAAGAP